MTRAQRRAHVRVWIALALVLPALIAAGLWARGPARDDAASAPSGAADRGPNP